MNKFKNRIIKLFFNTRLDKVLILSMLITLLITIGLSYYLILDKQYNIAKNRNIQHEKRILSFVCKSLKLQFQKNSFYYTKDLLKPLLEYKNIALIKVTNLKNYKTIFYKIFPKRLKGEIVKKECFVYQNNKAIAEIVINFSREGLKNEFSAYFLQSITLSIFQFLFMFILLLLIYHLKIYKPVKKLHKMVQNIKEIKFDNKIEWKYRDEINKIGRDLQKTTKIIKTLMHTDNLTKLYNRTKLEIVLTQQMNLAKEEKLPLSIILFNINNLHYINSFYGYFQGDTIFKKLSTFLLKYKRLDDTVGRWSAKEFLIIMPSTTHQEALKIAYNLQESLKIGVLDITIESSFGIGTYIANEDIQTLIQRAYKSLFISKNSPLTKESLD